MGSPKRIRVNVLLVEDIDTELYRIIMAVGGRHKSTLLRNLAKEGLTSSRDDNEPRAPTRKASVAQQKANVTQQMRNNTYGDSSGLIKLDTSILD
jgi:hypothetical protein